jgi:hypothetical protein
LLFCLILLVHVSVMLIVIIVVVSKYDSYY